MFDINFLQTLNESEEIEIEILWKIKNIKKKPSPFCSATISEPADNLKFTLEFPANFNIREFVFEHMYSMSSKEVIGTTTKTTTTNTIDFEVKKPKLLHHYQVRWFWS